MFCVWAVAASARLWASVKTRAVRQSEHSVCKFKNKNLNATLSSSVGGSFVKTNGIFCQEISGKDNISKTGFLKCSHCTRGRGKCEERKVTCDLLVYSFRPERD